MKSFFSRLTLSTTLTAGALFLGSPPEARAEKIYGLTTVGELFSFDSATPGTTTTPVAITGVTAGQTLVGMDFRPSTGDLYALSYSFVGGAAQLYLVNTDTAVASPIGGGITLAGNVTDSSFGFDFNPAVDRIRVIAYTGQNYRLNPNTGAIAATDTNVAYAAGDPNFGTTARVVGLAYANNTAGAATTTLYGYEYQGDRLVTVGGPGSVPSPNMGGVFTIGSSGFSASNSALDLDISTVTGIAYGCLQVPVYKLYSFNLTTGAGTSLGQIGSGLLVRDIAVPIVASPPASTPSSATPPAIALKTKKKVITSKATYTIAGTAANAAYVEVQVGKGGFRKAKGTSPWSFKARLVAGSNKVTARAVSASGAKTAPVKATIIRK